MTTQSSLFRSMFIIGMLTLLLAVGCAKNPPETDSSAGASSTSGDSGRMAGPGASSRGSSDQQSLDERRRAEQERMAREAFTNQDVHFDFDSYTLRSDAKAILEQKAAWMKANAGVTVQIEGHCDERGTNAYNLALGERRANATKQYMSLLGIEGPRMSTISYGEERPLDPGHSEAAWTKNRRAHFVILGGLKSS